VAVSLLSGSTVVYELPSGRELCRLATDVVTSRIAFDPGGHRLALGSSRPASVQIWDTDTDSVVAELQEIKAGIHSITWHPDGRHLALSLAEPAKRAEIWDIVTRERVTILEGHAQDVTFSRFLRSGSLIVTGSWDGTVRVWETDTARPLVAWPKGLVIAPDASGHRIGHLWNKNQLQVVELIRGEEYRTLASSLGPGQGDYWDGDISPDGRLLAVAMDDGVRVWDLPNSREVAYLPTDKTASPIFSPDGNELITSGLSGLLRWPLTFDSPLPLPEGEGGSDSRPSRDSELHAIHLGPPRAVPLPIVPFHVRSTRDGHTLALCSAREEDGLILDMATETIKATIKPNSQTDRVVLSPDGRWVATIGWHSATVQVWDARKAALVKELPLGPMTLAEFSPDSKHLITSRGDEFCFWEIGSWRKVNTLPRENCPYPGTVAFSPDGSVMALELASAVVSLLDTETGRTLAKLEDPHQDRPSWMSFTPDGSRFVIISKYARTIHVWNLRLLREQLATMELDWTSSPVSPSDVVAAEGTSRVTVDLGDFGPRAEALRQKQQAKTHYDLAQAHLQSKRWPEAVAASKRAVELSQENATYRNNLAWLLATCPDPLYRDGPLAAKHAQKAVELAPDGAEAWNTLGVARYRIAEWQIAIDALTKAEELKPGTYFAHNAFFLAMAYSRLGQEDTSRNWLDQAKAWLAKNNPSPHDREEIDRFRAEADELLR
jgi:WD40 repeat protein